MSEQNKYKRLGINTIFTFIGNVGPQFVSFLLVPFYTYWLTREDYGVQDLVFTCITLFIPYLSLGFYEAVFLFPKGKEVQEQKKYFSTAVITVTTIMVAILLIWMTIPSSIHKAVLPDGMQPYELYLVAALFVGPYQRIIHNFVRSLDKMRVFSYIGVVYAIVMLVLSLTTVPKFGLAGFFISFLGAEILSILYGFFAIKAWKYLSFSCYERQCFSEMIKYSLPLVPNTTMWWVVNSINRPIMLSTVGLGGIGLYAVSNKFPSIINIIFTVFFSALQISVVEEYGKKDYSTFYNLVFRIVLFIMILISFVFLLFGDLIFSLIIDERFQDGAYYVPILCLGAVLSSVSAYVGTTFTVLKKTKYFLYSSIVAAIVAVVANALLIPKYGIMGACVAICLSQLTMFLYRWIKSYKYVNFTNFGRILIISMLFIAAFIIYYLIYAPIIKHISLVLLLMFILYLNKDVLVNFEVVFSKIKQRYI
jgi:O-antigen/teichoic acid export membrane protein